MGRRGDGEKGRWGERSMGRMGDGEKGRWGEGFQLTSSNLVSAIKFTHKNSLYTKRTKPEQALTTLKVSNLNNPG